MSTRLSAALDRLARFGDFGSEIVFAPRYWQAFEAAQPEAAFPWDDLEWPEARWDASADTDLHDIR
jgi:hypothetical protein